MTFLSELIAVKLGIIICKIYITKETVYQYYFLDNKVFSLHYFPNIWHPIYQFSFPSKLANYYLKPDHIQAYQQLQKFLYPLLPEIAILIHQIYLVKKWKLLLY